MRRLIWIWVFGFCLLFSFVGATPAKESKPPKKTTDLVKTGKKLFEQNCTPCHGAKGDGKGSAAAALNPPPSDFAEPLKNWPNTKGDPQKIFGIISKGIPNSAMVGWPQLSEKERWGLVYYVMEFAGKKKK